ncbi:ribonuclease P protein component [Buchnera aphidicola]|uniref:Ribonuclease P protein component n=1 Tax=Buchnera aphidicola (Stegophylla sp.) TaxID=2315800 RepID=A0A4D6Y961_9GAMM|nr:ribonuclease P protein component [Buchnera aphidicola (Stegophylla sp.)]QCI26217.1 ribonuclease P protein component [Buchnera aphidicola (Stegophylla sp.)]
MKLCHKLLFPRKLRLLNTYDFNYVFQKSNQITHWEIIICNRYNRYDFPRMGIIISKKFSKYSYQRNHIKRIIKEHFRFQQHYLLPLDFIIIIKSNIIFYYKQNLQTIMKYLWFRYYKYI